MCSSDLVFDALDLTNSASVSGALPIANGGTGQTTKGPAFNALSPVTTQGDLIIGDAANQNTRLGIGAASTVLTSNGTTASWQSPSTTSVGCKVVVTSVTGLTVKTLVDTPGSDDPGVLFIFPDVDDGSPFRLTLPDASGYADTTHSKFLTVLQLTSRQFQVQGTDADGNTVLGPGSSSNLPTEIGDTSGAGAANHNESITFRAWYDSSIPGYRWNQIGLSNV